MQNQAIFQLDRFRVFSSGREQAKPLVCLQGGGLKGAWQAGVLQSLLYRGLKPVAAYGTSAGAINSVLISAALGGKVDILTDFWRNLPQHTIPLLLRNACDIVKRLPRTGIGLLRSYTPRVPGLLPFDVFLSLLASKLPADLVAEIHTYIEITALQGAGPPEVRPFRGPSLWLHQGANQFEASFLDRGIHLSIPYALAASCCVPGLIEVGKIEDVPVADGGVYTNLPIERLPESGSLGGQYIVLILSRPLSLHKPSQSDIDFRTIRALHDVKRIQLSEIDRLKTNRQGKYNTLVHPPIFIICPDRALRMDRPWWWLHHSSMDSDIKDGLSTGDRFYEALQRTFDGNNAAVEKYCLLTKDLPPLPAEAPRKPWWYAFANTSWLTSCCPTYKFRGRKKPLR